MTLPAGAPLNLRASDLDVPEEVRAWCRATNDFDRSDNPASWIKDEGIWNKAKAAVQPHWDEYDEPYAVVTHVYEQMGGTIEGKSHKATRKLVIYERDVEHPDRGADGLFKAPSTYTADFEVVEKHRREGAANHFKYADKWCGNPRTFDPDGRYNCGRCNQFAGGKCLLLKIDRVNPEAGSCGDWENQFDGDPEVELHEKSADAASYGVAANGDGFGCFRCPYGHPTTPDSLGRDWWCGKFAARTLRNACCSLNGAPLVPQVAERGTIVAERHHAPALLLDADSARETRFCAAVLLDASPAAGAGTETDLTAPRWIQVAAEGAYAKNGQQFTLDRAVFEQIVKNIRSRPSFRKGPDGNGIADVVPFDWRHASEMPPTVPGAFASQQALGWALDFDVRSGTNGKAQLWALARFLPEAADAIKKGAVKWTSIAVWPNATDPHGRAIGWDISSIALTNDPHIQGMIPIGACRFGRGDEQIPAAPAATNPATNRERRPMDEQLKALLIALGNHLNCAPTVEAIQHQAPLTFGRVAKLEKEAADEPGRVAFMKKLLADDGDGDAANTKDFDDVMKKIHGRMSAKREALSRMEAEKTALAKDRDGLMAELEGLYGGEVKDEEDRVGKDVKATMERNGLDAGKDQSARIAFSGLCLERTGGVMPTDRKAYADAGKWLEDTKRFLAARREARTKFLEQYPAPEAPAAPVTPSTAPYLFQRYGGPEAAPPAGPVAFMRGGRPGAPSAAPIALGNGGRPLADGPQPSPEQGGLDFSRFLACAGRNVTEKAVNYVKAMDPANVRLEQAQLFELARPIARRANELAVAQGISF